MGRGRRSELPSPRLRTKLYLIHFIQEVCSRWE
jgi:hypothetical protein